jgi:tetratricopeptide (TPR) repeat protein
VGGRRVRVFHISDLHMRSVDGPQRDRARLEAGFRWRVLGERWTVNLAELRRDGVPFDLVAFTGDLGDWGNPTDYPRALTFLKQTCTALDVPLERLFVVPGNHDIARGIQPAVWESLRSELAKDSRACSKWLAGADVKALRGDNRRDAILERQQAFWAAVATEIGRPELVPSRSPHGRLGFRCAVMLPGLAQPLQVIGLDTAWLAGDDHDTGQLRLTEHQVSMLTTTAEGAPLPGFRLALMHHRLADLADGAEARKLLADRVELLLHGHQHEPTADVFQGPDHQLLVLAAGCLYEGDEEHRYLNTCQVIDLELDEEGRPLGAEVRFRGWSARDLFWGDDALLYQRARGGRLRLRHGVRGWAFDDGAPSSAPRPPVRHKVFVGRDREMERIGAEFDRGGSGRVALVAVQGMAGVGKTYLADEFYARYPSRFGSYQHVVLDPERPGTVATWLGVLGERAGIEPARVDAPAVAAMLGAQRALVHVDNVDSAVAAALVAELADALDGVLMLVTGRYAELGTAAGSDWTRIELAPLDQEIALELVQAELQEAAVTVAEAELRELVRQVAGLPLALHLAAGYLRRGVTVARFLERLRAQGLALGPKDPSDHLRRERARGVLSTSFALSRELLLAEAGARAPAWEAALVALGWVPRAGFGRSLGAAITGLERAAFEDFIEAAGALSLVQGLRPEERAGAAWAVHPLLGEFLRMATEREEIDARVGDWVAERADGAESEQAARWDELAAESPAIGEWLGVATSDVVAALLPRAWVFAESRGPVGPWLAAAQRLRRTGAATRGVLWALCHLAEQAGELETVYDAATEMEWLARAADDDRDRALALGKIADVLGARGELDEALRIRRDEELPVYDRLGDVQSRAITLGQIADVLFVRGELDEALRIRREEQLPVFDRFGEVRERAITLGKIADVLFARGELDEALRIHREEVLPVFHRLGDVRACAIMLAKIADVLESRGELDEALRIRREEVLPVFDRLGDVHSRAAALGKIADVLFARGEQNEALRIRREEALPAFDRLGDVRERAITLGKIADMLFVRGELDQALRMWREALAVFERLGAQSLIAGARQRIAKIAEPK